MLIDSEAEHIPNDAPEGAGATDIAADKRREITQARALVEKAERLMDGANAEEKEDLVDLIESVQDAIAANDLPAIERAVAELSDLVYYLET